MICPVCEGSNLEPLTIFRFWCRDCRAARDNSMRCVFVFGEAACGVHAAAGVECAKTFKACGRFGNQVRFGGMMSPTLAGPVTAREQELRLEAFGLKVQP